MKILSTLRLAFVATLGVTTLAVASFSTEALSAPVCDATGANCKVGDVGPGGGTIYYDAGSQQWWGRFLEAKLTPVVANAVWSAQGNSSIYGPDVTQALQRRSMSIGMGAENTKVLRAAQSPLVQKHFPVGEDWFLPSKDELDALYNSSIYASVQRPAVPVWTSSESEAGFAWYQLFQDGTQFTDAQGIIPKLKANVNYLKSPKHVGSDFKPVEMNLFKVRAFPVGTGPLLSPGLVTTIRDNLDCSTKAINCAVGDKGPAGGIIVYDAGSKTNGGRYFEIAPQACELKGIAFGNPALGAAYLSSAMRIAGKAIGSGVANSARLLAIRKSPAVAAVSNSTCGGYSDWFLPSKDELNEAFRHLSHSRKGLNLTPVGGFQRGYYWTSSDYNGSTAWTQYFADGQQFDRVQTLTGNKQPPARPFMIRPMRRFDAGQVTGGIGLKEMLGQTIFISPKKSESCGFTGVEGSTTGLAPNTEVIAVIWVLNSNVQSYGAQYVAGVVDRRGRFSISIPFDWGENRALGVHVQTGDRAVNSNPIIGYQINCR
jgi:hypothetical protein